MSSFRAASLNIKGLVKRPESTRVAISKNIKGLAKRPESTRVDISKWTPAYRKEVMAAIASDLRQLSEDKLRSSYGKHLFNTFRAVETRNWLTARQHGNAIAILQNANEAKQRYKEIISAHANKF